jgi:hypothetical protein
MPGRGVAAAIVLAGLLLCGCGKPGQQEPVEVRGHIMLPATVKPGAFLVVQFHAADEAARGTGDVGLIGDDGGFNLHCIPGKYRATIAAAGTGATPLGGPGGNPAGSPQQLGIPPKYLSFSTTPLEVVVPPGGKPDVELLVK